MAEDQRLTCADCSTGFVFTTGEQRFYRERGLTHAPTRCKSCRDQRKMIVHFCAIHGDGFRTLQEGDRVEFEIVSGPKGRQAANVVRVV